MHWERSTSRVSAWRRSDERCVTKNDHSDRAIARRSPLAQRDGKSKLQDWYWYVRFARSRAARAHDTTMKTATHAAQGRGQAQSRQAPRHRLGDTTPSGVGGRATRGSAATGGATAHRTPRSTRKRIDRHAAPEQSASEARGRSPAEKSTRWRRSRGARAPARPCARSRRAADAASIVMAPPTNARLSLFTAPASGARTGMKTIGCA